jgi:hypothetical protein
MRTFTLGLVIFSLIAGAACQDDSSDRNDDESSRASPLSHLIPQVAPPIDIKSPPEDATKTSSGLAMKTLTAREAGAQARRGDTVMVHYTGWRQRTGETFFTTKVTSQPLSLDVEHAAPMFSEALQRLRKGEKAVLWVPASESTPEPLVYEVEVIDIVSPPQVAKPTALGDDTRSKVPASGARTTPAPASSNDAPNH